MIAVIRKPARQMPEQLALALSYLGQDWSQPIAFVALSHDVAH